MGGTHFSKMSGADVIDAVTKMGGAHLGKNWWNSLWRKWVELTVTKMGGAGVIEASTKMGGAHCGKNGWNSLWQKWVELTLAKIG